MSSTIPTGTRLGRYEIRSLIGAGGMGEVYLAHDAKLDRAVALKMLPAELAADQNRMKRFVQEARAASALNHPNIITIYEIEDADTQPHIAMEFIDGETLRDRMKRKGGIRLAEALDVVTQIASALSAAHTAGIVHRDIKPENIMVRRDGYIKVLDFGLAKLTERTSSSVDTEAATRALVNTDPGAVMGTVHYMSPEQARGLEVDARTDLWSLGVLLYELVTGHLPFKGATATDTILAIVDKEPPPLAHHVPDAPEALEWIITKALTKDREDRYQTAREMLTDLRRLKQRLDVNAEIERSVAPHISNAPASFSSEQQKSTVMQSSAARTAEMSATSTISSAEYVTTQIKGHKKGVILALAAILIGAGALMFAWYKFAHQEKPSAPTAGRMKISRLVTGVPDIGTVSISPDGKYVAYGFYKQGAVSLHVRQISTGSDREIVAPIEDGGIGGTVFSPDGELVYYNLNHREKSPLGTLYQVPVIGGREPKKILEHMSGIISFAPDGKHFAFFRDFGKTGDSALMVGSLDGSVPRELARRKGNDWFGGVPAWSPDGRVIVCPAATDTGGTQFTLVEVPAEGGAEKPITSYKWHGQIYRPAWLKDGSGLIVNAREMQTSPTQIWHLSYPEGAVTRVTNDLTQYGSMSFGLTADSSTIVTISSEQSSKIWLAAPSEEEGRARKLTDGKYDGLGGFDWTPDGRVVYVTRSGDYSDIWIMNADGTGQKQLTSNEDSENNIRVSPDGRYIVFASSRAGGLQHIFRMDTDGGSMKQLTEGDFGDYNPFWSPDGQWVFFGSWRSGNGRMWKVSADGGQPAQVSDLAFNGWRFPSAGKLIYGNYYDEQVSPPRWRTALVSPENGQLVKVFDFPPKTGVWDMLDERTLIYAEESGDVANLWTRPLEGGPPRQLTRFTSERIFNHVPSRDGKQFAIARGTTSADIILIKDFR